MKEVFDTALLRVERPNFDNGLTEAQKNHPSEVDMDNYNFDYLIYNDSDIKSLKAKVENFIFEKL